jgi:hypothetical protein
MRRSTLERHLGTVADLSSRTAGEWFDLGLLAKRERRWVSSLECNRRATELDPSDKSAWWNLGVAATALGDWATARRAWRAFGVEIPEGSGPPDLSLGPVPIRLNPGSAQPEVVWASRLDPARAIVESLPLPSSGRRYGDLLLHDGEPTGTRLLGGRKVPIFDELELLQASEHSTFRTTIEAPNEEAVDALLALFRSGGMSFEDWTASLHAVCHACSVRPPHSPDHKKAIWAERREVGVAAIRVDDAMAALIEWGKTPGCSFSPLELALGGARRS